MIPDTFQTLVKGTERLILPGFAVGNSAWKKWEHRWLRSLHLDADDRIISSGWPKFMNLGEGVDRFNVSVDRILESAGRDLRATLKIDGSLLIRYVQNGKVKFRTRGSFGVHMENAFEINEFGLKYHSLLDPSIATDDSILFEWVSPLCPIVIRYPDSALHLIGGVRYDKDRPWHEVRPKLYHFDELEQLSEKMGVPLVHAYPLRNAEEVTKLIEDLKSDKDIEGFVLRFNGDQEMVKIKAQHFTILHALKSNLTTTKLVELWQSWDGPNYMEFSEKFQAVYDFETWTWAMPVVSSMFDGIRTSNKIVAHVSDFVESSRELDRKSFALASTARFNQLRLSMCFQLWDRRPVSAEIMQKLILQNCKQVEKKMFQPDDDS